MRIILALLSVLVLAGCVATAPLAEQVPAPSYVAGGTVAVSVVDERERVREGGNPAAIGRAHGLYGIPATWRVHPAISVEDGDRERTTAQWLQHRLARGLADSGWSVEQASLPMDATAEDVAAAMGGSPALLLLRLKEWWFSMNLNWVSAYTFTNDVEVSVYRQGEGLVLAKRFEAKDIIDEKASESPRNNILRMYSGTLTRYLEDPEVRAALESAAAL